MLKHKLFVFYILIIMAMVVQACTPGAAAASQAPEDPDPVSVAATTIADATQRSLDPVSIAATTIAKATQQSLDPVLVAATIVAAATQENSFLNPSNFATQTAAAPTIATTPTLVWLPYEPLPDDSFTAVYTGITDRCNKYWWARITITNQSSSLFKSISMDIEDSVTGEQRLPNRTTFNNIAPDICVIDKSDASTITIIQDLGPNASFVADSPVFLYNPSGHEMEAVIKLCTEKDLQGQCVVKTIFFQAGTIPEVVDTSDSGSPYVILGAGTNCRTGAGTEFELVGAYGPGKRIPVFGKDQTGDYLLVESPYDPGITCWMVSSYITESGNLDNVQIFPVPPVPTADAPGFEAIYAGVVCSKQVEIKLKNVGTNVFKSITISVSDTVADISLSISSNEFSNIDGCLPPVSISKLDPGDSFTVSSPIFPADPTGHKLIATLRLCTEDDQGGQCSEKKIEFTP